MATTKIISVCGANGSGKTTMAVNLATALTQTGSVVGLIQTELAYPSIQGFLGMRIEENKPNIKKKIFCLIQQVNMILNSNFLFFRCC